MKCRHLSPTISRYTIQEAPTRTFCHRYLEWMPEKTGNINIIAGFIQRLLYFVSLFRPIDLVLVAFWRLEKLALKTTNMADPRWWLLNIRKSWRYKMYYSLFTWHAIFRNWSSYIRPMTILTSLFCKKRRLLQSTRHTYSKSLFFFVSI